MKKKDDNCLYIHLTARTRLDVKHGNNKELFDYLLEYRTFYARIQRTVWYDIINKNPLTKNRSKYVTYISKKFNILARVANSIVLDMHNRYNALIALKKTELKQAQQKLKALKKELAKDQKTFNKLKTKVAVNKATDKQLMQYRNLKKSNFKLHKLIHKKIARLRKLELIIKSGNVRMCFGTKKLWKAQYHLKENGFKSHAAWLKAFREKRDRSIYYRGREDDTSCNQLFQLKPQYDDLGRLKDFNLTARIDTAFQKLKGAKNIECKKVQFKYLRKEIAACVDKNLTYKERASLSDLIHRATSVSYRLRVLDDKLYVFASFEIEAQKVTDAFEGTIGIDFNNAFLESVEIDRQGNILHMEKYDLWFHGEGNKAKTEMQEIVNKLMYRCRLVGKDLVIEDLDFSDKKAATRAKSGKLYNDMLHKLDYSRFRDICMSTGTRLGVSVTIVNPANTTKIGKQKYANQRKLTAHQAAAYVIARKGKGFKDALIKTA